MGQGGGTGGLVGIWGREAVACIFAVVRLARPAMATLSHPPPLHFTLRLPLSPLPPPLRSLPWPCPLNHTPSNPRNATLHPLTPHLLSSMYPRPRMCRLRGTLRPPSPLSPSSNNDPTEYLLQGVFLVYALRSKLASARSGHHRDSRCLGGRATVAAALGYPPPNGSKDCSLNAQ